MGKRVLAKRVPSLRLHKPSGQGVVTLNGKDHYLGPYGSEAVKTKYNRMISDWLARGRTALVGPNSGTITALVQAYVAHAHEYYVKEGWPTSRIGIIRSIGRKLIVEAGNVAIGNFKPADLIAIRRLWIEEGKARRTVNDYTASIREIFRWGVEGGIVPADVWYGLKAVRLLAPGRSAARETEPIGTVDQARIDAVIAVVKEEVRDMIRVQVLTGMRPMEVANLRGREIDRTDAVWVYKPPRHKTEHHHKSRVVALGPKAQVILAPRLELTGPDGLAFTAAKSKTKTQWGDPEWRRMSEAYSRAIRKGCVKAGIEPWCANQLRHNAATLIRSLYGLEEASKILGHSSVTTTEIYAERDLAVIKRIAREIG